MDRAAELALKLWPTATCIQVRGAGQRPRQSRTTGFGRVNDQRGSALGVVGCDPGVDPVEAAEPRCSVQDPGFPSEGGPAMLGVDVPDDIITLAVDEKYFPMGQGFVQFDEDAGLEELRENWPNLRRRVISLECP